ncbi:MAG: M4 family metallopeptidase [Prevotellaceae bacterium]|jgi:Zn-dependent metalloprotease|nr:M4 family metallopeptidase [Prevotellaceae bacterium]
MKQRLVLFSIFMLTLLCQTVYSYAQDIVKSSDLRIDKSKFSLNDNKTKEILQTQFKLSNDYEFRTQIIKGAKDETIEHDDLGYKHERYAQYYKGLKIEHSDIRAHYLNDSLVSINGEYINQQNIDVSIILSKTDAIQKAKDYIGAKKYMWEDEAANNWLKSIKNDKSASFYPNAEIVICQNSMNLHDTMLHVAYKIDIYATEPVRHDYIYVDAQTGHVLAVIPILINVDGTAATRYSGTCTISTQQNGSVYRLRDYSRGNGIETYNLNHSTSISSTIDFTDNNNNWTAAEFHNANKDDGALDAHWGAMMTYDYFKNIHGRNSYDNSNSIIRNYVHYGTNYENAGWDQQYHYMIYGDGGSYFDILTSLDVIAHEIGHGVCQYTANLTYQGESGAINESLSDIWGACIENWATTGKQTWLLGEDIGTPIRSMSNPNTYSDPDTYQGTYWVNTTSGSDNGGVHTNSGVMNYWFYLLSVGGSGTNDIGNAYNVTGIGIDKAAKIVYRAESVYMTSGTNFNNARAYTIAAATDLYGASSIEIPAVTNAWYAVGIGNQYQYVISGPSSICPNTNATFTATNAPANFTWGKSSNLTLVSSSGNTATFTTSSTTGTGWVSIKQGGTELASHSFDIGTKAGSISLPRGISCHCTVSSVVAGNTYQFFARGVDDSEDVFWELDRPDGYISIHVGSSPLISFGTAGIYTLRMRWIGACGYSPYVSRIINVEENWGGYSYLAASAYPNPVSDILNIEIEENTAVISDTVSSGRAISGAVAKTSVFDVSLYTILGSRVRRTTVQSGKTTIDVSGLPNGVYILNISDGVNEPVVKKIVVAH